MASPSPHIDEEDFDWDAAVREIDYACQSAIPSTSNDSEVSPVIPAIAPTSFGSGFCTRPAAVPSCRTRQTTLNRYINSYTKENSKSNLQESVAGACLPRVDNFEAEDGAPSVSIDLEAAKTWIYPVNVPLRDYQFSIAKKALFSNTLVVLPTGLGKTLIAAVVMYNYFRWFPEGKIVFSAPSRPLVIQQIEACHNIVGIPQEWTIDMTGQMSPSKRSKFWTAKRVFFVTPQVFEKDIQSGICLTSQLVCLVFDEAHRAMGNYSYCVAVRELMAIRVQLRILALSATPGSKQLTIQNAIDNLCISTLEYRHESDHDVSSYVNGRKLELIEVSMGKEAIEVNSMLLQAIQPFAARLCSLGALPQRDFSTLSPSELLNLRDKFRQAPPHSLPHSKYGEIEAYFCALITFYHIRKLLSSHGIRPAYEMLQAKLNQGSFSKLVSKIEVFWKAKLLMQQFLSHGAPTHKMVKMLEILIDHFKTKNSDGSRVIIFTNFRGSVRDIMNYLSGIGDMIKATEFIGQSSGKTLKGQTQKVQQAVLEKFRLGVYNVIVATSVGEEGLDIMEVDLVICFDANVSPLRMIQRMGRTGRKNDGRVVVLACEGSELKAYLKKKASSQAIRKHLHNGGVKSFNFHPSPRMVPHICKPQVQYLEMSIEQFIPRGKKAKNETMDKSPLSLTISNEELSLISNYFPHSGDITRKPSLIAFPCFQAFSSHVGKVKHSFRTTAMFIDAMQDLQGLSFSKVNKDNFIQMENPSQPHNELCASPCSFRQGTVYPTGDVDLPATFLVSASEYLDNKVGSHIIHLDIQNPKPHCFLFSEGSVSINSMGRVLIDYVPVIQHKSFKYFKDILLENPLSIEEPKVNPSTDLQQSGNGLPSSLLIQAIQNDQENVKHSFQTGVSKVEHKELDSPFEVNNDMEETLPASIGRSRTEADDIELSPRLTHFIEEGIVPESPVLNDNQLLADDKKYGLICSLEIDKDTFFVNKLSSNGIAGSSDLPSKENSMHEKVRGRVKNTISESTYDGNTIYTTDEAVRTLNAVNEAVHAPTIINETVNTPNTVKEAVHTTSIMLRSSSEDWKCSSGEASTSFFRAAKYKRLHKNGDAALLKLPTKTLDERFKLYEEGYGITTSSKVNKLQFSNGGKEKADGHVGVFIDEEAEVSGDASVSEDEIDIEKNDQYDDSFIDDRISPTEGSAEAEKSEVDMIAFYRRSLLTQSPIIFQEKCQPASLESPSSGTYTLLDYELEKEKMKNKRKIVFQPSGSPSQEENFLPCDDDFYEGLDLDEVEAQATKLLRCKSESIGISQSPLPEKGKGADIGFICSPSFDLGF